ncbi:M15 family metallopeptidase [Aquisalimonas asiatica]|uniref:D-alanyl-D-alanine carboxypeptidase n=1 Tax=Aquisalimonas asiatica TaxID=406100 RepID=A0A1H8QVH8_9GAMM|nr:M15 family metallopeptidase [Aquisalimonas asiatica]SEO57961.1 D-alanyl-D-alanine carboxypeptidase [Aquisalimonas asiatica]
MPDYRPLLLIGLVAPALLAADPACESPALETPDAGYKALVHGLHRQLDVPADYTERTGLPMQPQAEELRLIAIDQRRGAFFMSPDAARAWLRMQAAARMDGVELFPASTFRSVYQQTTLLSRRLDNGQAIADILRTSAAPGFSEHHTGDAIDIATPGGPGLTREFAETDAFEWLEAHAEAFCFALSYPEDNDNGLIFEPWHWMYQRAD